MTECLETNVVCRFRLFDTPTHYHTYSVGSEYAHLG
jgi:hypothetical protein